MPWARVSGESFEILSKMHCYKNGFWSITTMQIPIANLSGLQPPPPLRPLTPRPQHGSQPPKGLAPTHAGAATVTRRTFGLPPPHPYVYRELFRPRLPPFPHLASFCFASPRNDPAACAPNAGPTATETLLHGARRAHSFKFWGITSCTFNIACFFFCGVSVGVGLGATRCNARRWVRR